MPKRRQGDSAGKRGIFAALLVGTLGIIAVATSRISSANNSNLNNEFAGGVQGSNQGMTISMSPPNVVLRNNSLIAHDEVPTSIVFTVSSQNSTRFLYAIASDGAQVSTGLIQTDQVPLPKGVSVAYPTGKSLDSNPSTALVTLTFSAGAGVNVPLELVVYELLGNSGQALGVTDHFTFQVTP